jgi:hypothetical protein
MSRICGVNYTVFRPKVREIMNFDLYSSLKNQLKIFHLVLLCHIFCAYLSFMYVTPYLQLFLSCFFVILCFAVLVELWRTWSGPGDILV